MASTVNEADIATRDSSVSSYCQATNELLKGSINYLRDHEDNLGQISEHISSINVRC